MPPLVCVFFFFGARCFTITKLDSTPARTFCRDIQNEDLFIFNQEFPFKIKIDPNNIEELIQENIQFTLNTFIFRPDANQESKQGQPQATRQKLQMELGRGDLSIKKIFESENTQDPAFYVNLWTKIPLKRELQQQQPRSSGDQLDQLAPQSQPKFMKLSKNELEEKLNNQESLLG